ncbi:MAG: alpha-ketoglutarate-dependent dioxygenase AlkB [Alphaproteobacteria bacterium]|nr:alpha-ketoglutarate-dependent dioxygenase AlkB [Alphaproteobacteria bacterium]
MTPHPLDAEHHLLLGTLPAALRPGPEAFEALWDLHPDEHHEVVMAGRPVNVPRWQQAYGRDYRFTGRVSRALPVPPELEPLLAWGRTIEPQVNSLLLNWYDGRLGHYIGRHRDKTAPMVPGTPIITVSLGEARVFRMRPWRQPGMVDVPIPDGAVVLIPWATNLAFTHEVPKSAKAQGRRISVTLRAFRDDPDDGTISPRSR